MLKRLHEKNPTSFLWSEHFCGGENWEVCFDSHFCMLSLPPCSYICVCVCIPSPKYCKNKILSLARTPFDLHDSNFFLSLYHLHKIYHIAIWTYIWEMYVYLYSHSHIHTHICIVYYPMRFSQMGGIWEMQRYWGIK